MANRKLKNFEFSDFSGKGKETSKNNDEVVFFECSNGSIFLICSDSDGSRADVNPSALAAQRMRYYLENEFVPDPSVAIQNALIYTNGFIFENARKNEQFQGVYVHCACVLIRESKVYYSTSGNVMVKFFPGKKLYVLSQGDNNRDVSSQSNLNENTGLLLGMQREIAPDVNSEPFIPLNGDILIAGNSGFFDGVGERNLIKILDDQMPLQTKAMRLADLALTGENEENPSFQLISFYNLEHQNRSFKATSGFVKTPKPHQSITLNKPLSAIDWQALKEKVISTPLKYVLILIAALLLGFMVYDMFFSVPAKKVVRAEPRQTDSVTEVVPVIQPVETPQRAAEPEVQVPARKVPEDRNYQVRSGDTWGRIYTQFGVCSWFIRSHPANTGKFDKDDNPVSGSRLVIPVIYSARRDMNPDFYREFSIEKTGSRCENANQEFVDNFRKANQLP